MSQVTCRDVHHGMQGMESDEDAINELNVVIVKGENIKAMDVDEGTSGDYISQGLPFA